MSHWISELSQADTTYLAACGIIESAIRRKVGRLEPLGNHCGILSGYAFKSADFVPEGERLLRNKNVQPDFIDWTDQAALDPDQAKEYERFRLFDGDLIMSMDGPITKRGLKIAFLGPSDMPALLLQRVCRLENGESLNRRYLYHILHSDHFVRHSIASNRSIAIPHVSAKQIKAYDLPMIEESKQEAVADFLDAVQQKRPSSQWPQLPTPIEDQRRIVAKIERLAAKVEEAHHLAVQIDAESKALVAASRGLLYKESTRVPLGTALVECRGGGWGDAEDANGVAVLRANAIRDDGSLSLSDLRFRAVAQKQVGKLELRDGDILLTKSNSIERVGNSTVFHRPEGDSTVYLPSNFLQLMRVDESRFMPRFVWHCLMSPAAKTHWTASASGTSPSLQNLNATKIKALEIPVCSLEEQRRGVGTVDSVLEKVYGSEAARKTRNRELHALLPSILDKAFKGEL